MSGGGHIRRRGAHSWGIKFDVPSSNGARQTRYTTVRGTRRQAQARLTELLSESARGITADPSKESLAAFLTRWDAWASTNLSGKTLERYRGLITHQILPVLGAISVQRLRPVHLQEAYAKLLQGGGITGKPLSSRTVGHVHRLLHRALGHATTWGILLQNPASVVSPPRVHAKEIEIIRDDEVRIVLEALRGQPLRMIAVLALATGMRRGELLGLRYRDIDLEAGKIRIERTLEQTRTGLRFKAPKTRHGRRTITIPACVVEELRVHRLAQQKQRLALGLGREGPDDLLFTAADGEPMKPNVVTNEWLRATAAVGRSVGLHALRHTHASSLIHDRVDIVTVSRRLGHASPEITLRVYAHLLHDTDDRTTQAVEAMFARMQSA
jgi:integrase